MRVEFEREYDLDGEPTTELTADVYLDDGGVTLRLGSDDVEGDREWTIVDLQIGVATYDVREAVFSQHASRGPEATLPEGEVLAAVRAAYVEWAVREPATRT